MVPRNKASVCSRQVSLQTGLVFVGEAKVGNCYELHYVGLTRNCIDWLNKTLTVTRKD